MYKICLYYPSDSNSNVQGRRLINFIIIRTARVLRAKNFTRRPTATDTPRERRVFYIHLFDYNIILPRQTVEFVWRCA